MSLMHAWIHSCKPWVHWYIHHWKRQHCMSIFFNATSSHVISDSFPTWDHINMNESNCHWNLYWCEWCMLLSPVRMFFMRSTLTAIIILKSMIHSDTIDMISSHGPRCPMKLPWFSWYFLAINIIIYPRFPNATGNQDFNDPYWYFGLECDINCPIC